MSLLSTLAYGVGFISVGFFILVFLFKMRPQQAGVVISLLTMGLFIAYNLVDWRGPDVFAIHTAIFLATALVLALVTSHMMQVAGVQRKFHWFPVVLVLFFMVIVGMNSVLITAATSGLQGPIAQWLLPEPKSDQAAQGKVSSHFPGTYARNYQKRLHQFNDYQNSIKEQIARGWQVKKGFLKKPVAGQAEYFRVQILDKAEQPITGAKISAAFNRPSNAKLDVDMTLTEIEPGIYQGVVSLPNKGRWHLLMVINVAEKTHEVQGFTMVGVAP